MVSCLYVLPCVSWNGLFTCKLCQNKNISMVLWLYVLARVAWNNLFSCKFCDNYYRCVVSHLCVPICVALNGLFHCKFCDNDHMITRFNQCTCIPLWYLSQSWKLVQNINDQYVRLHCKKWTVWGNFYWPFKFQYHFETNIGILFIFC